MALFSKGSLPHIFIHRALLKPCKAALRKYGSSEETALPKLIRFVLVNSLIGIAIGWFIAAALLFTDVGGLGGLYARSDVKPQILARMLKRVEQPRGRPTVGGQP